MIIRLCVAAGAMAALLAAQKPFADQSPSSIRLTGEKDGERTISIRNVTYRYTQDRVSGRPVEERLTLRSITDASDIIGDIPQPGHITMEAWPLGVPLTQKPIYAIEMEGGGARTVDNSFWVVDRGYEDLSAWSVYKLGTGQHMFDTYVELLRFSIAKDVQTPRYAGLEVPPDDAGDARLKDPHVVAVVSYASADKVIREVLLTHTNPSRAREPAGVRGYRPHTHIHRNPFPPAEDHFYTQRAGRGSEDGNYAAVERRRSGCRRGAIAGWHARRRLEAVAVIEACNCVHPAVGFTIFETGLHVNLLGRLSHENKFATFGWRNGDFRPVDRQRQKL